MQNYSTLVEAIDDLKERGYKIDFTLKPTCLEYSAQNLVMYPKDFEIVEIHRFEGFSDPNDSDVLYAIEGRNGEKGYFTDAYGTYNDTLSPDMLDKLRVKHNPPSAAEPTNN